MAWRYLGESFDIHGGGSDLIFPHHENEVAQSLCAFPGSHFARVWMHNGMLRVNGEKMAKSLGNFLTVRDALARAPAEAVRLLLLRTQYRAELDFSDAALEESRRELDRWYRALDRTPAEPLQHALRVFAQPQLMRPLVEPHQIQQFRNALPPRSRIHP